MPDLKLAELAEATQLEAVRSVLTLFFGPEESIRLESTRVEPPECFWGVYRVADRRVVLKSFFSEDAFKDYVGWLNGAYPERMDRPEHPRGGLLLRPELNAVLWAYPFDPAMPGLPDCADGEWIAGVMKRRRGRPIIPGVVSYRPEIGALLSYRPEGATRPLAFGKVTPEETCGLVYAVMNRLWNSEARESGRLRLARPLAFRPQAGLLLQAAVPGKMLEGHRNRQAFFDLAAHAGTCLAALQATEAPFGSRRTLEHLLRRLDSRQDEAKLLAPRLYRPLRDLTVQIRERARKEPPESFGPSHGDYKWDQFLESRGRFSLIDFELFCQADPAFDAGYYCAYVPPSRPEDWREGAAGEMCRSAFLHAYQTAAREPVSYARIALYEAAMLAVRGFSHVWTQRAGWELQASQLIDLGFERLASPEPGPLPETPQVN